MAFASSCFALFCGPITVNEQGYFYNDVLIKLNEELKIEITDVTVNGQLVDQSKVSYKWEKSCPAPNGIPGLMFKEIIGENKNVYSTASYDGAQKYRCIVTVEGVGYRSKEIWLKEDTLSVTGQSNKPFIFDEEDGNYYINDLSVGEEVTLTINANSTIQGAIIKYKWNGGDAYIQPDSELEEGFEVANTTNTLNVTKKVGQQNYFCEISDGQVTRYVYFMLNSKDTMTDSIMANGEYPGTYAGTYIYVTEPHTSVTINIPATSTMGDIEYKWYYDTEGYNSPARLDNTSDTITVTKSKMTEENPYAWEVYQCYLEDDNERVRYWIMLFCLDPETPLSEIKKIGDETPEIEFKTKSEDLANTVLSGDELMALSNGVPVEVTLSAELKKTVSKEEKSAIDETLAANSSVGMYLDINLYKGFEGEGLQVSELNKPIEISVDMPQNLINKKDGVERKYSIVRVHNGVAETIPCTYDKTTNKIDFSSDKFSTYTVVYTDTVEKVKDKSTEKETHTSDKNEADNTKSPATGDNLTIEFWLVLTSVFGFAVVTSLKTKKKNSFIKI